MSTNDVVLVEAMLKRERDRLAPSESDDDFANYFTAARYLQAYNLSGDEVLEGVVDGSHDCGLDGIYIFVNGMHVRDDTPVGAFGRNARLDLVLIQVKYAPGFSEAAVDKLTASLPRLLRFNRDEAELASWANPRLIEVTRRFLTAYAELDMPALTIYTAFASLKAVDGPHPNVVGKSEYLEAQLGGLFSSATFETHFLDARSLFQLSHQTPDHIRRLSLAENPISTDRAGGYVGLVRLGDFEDFITGENGELEVALFEANVRDYEGETSVNASIQATLSAAEEDVDFWWLNNGITIVANRVQLANKVLELESPQIVNGLQTSTEIYKRRRADASAADSRGLLVKVLQADDSATRDRIIRATNSQAAFGPSVLRATDGVQRQVEEFLLSRGLYYERRRVKS